MDLRELYQEVIIDHNKHPRNFSCLASPTHQAEGFNPLCGDRITLHLKVEENRIIEVGFQGAGCAISTASSSMMTEIVKGKTLEEAKSLFDQFHALLMDKAVISGGPDLGKLEVLSGVKAYPARVKCATLAWHALQEAIGQDASHV